MMSCSVTINLQRDQAVSLLQTAFTLHGLDINAGELIDKFMVVVDTHHWADESKFHRFLFDSLRDIPYSYFDSTFESLQPEFNITVKDRCKINVSLDGGSLVVLICGGSVL